MFIANGTTITKQSKVGIVFRPKFYLRLELKQADLRISQLASDPIRITSREILLNIDTNDRTNLE